MTSHSNGQEPRVACADKDERGRGKAKKLVVVVEIYYRFISLTEFDRSKYVSFVVAIICFCKPF